jgi:hypothetical protein
MNNYRNGLRNSFARLLSLITWRVSRSCRACHASPRGAVITHDPVQLARHLFAFRVDACRCSVVATHPNTPGLRALERISEDRFRWYGCGAGPVIARLLQLRVVRFPDGAIVHPACRIKHVHSKQLLSRRAWGAISGNELTVRHAPSALPSSDSI